MLELLRRWNKRLGVKGRIDLVRNYVAVFGWKEAIRTSRLLSDAHVSGPMPVRIPGYDFPVLVRPGTADVSTFKKIFVWRGYDLHYPFQPRAILDGGANIGLSSIWFARRFPGARVIAVEPENGNFELLKENVRHFGSIVPIHAAIWSHSTTVSLRSPDARVDSYRFAEDTERGTTPAFGIGSLMQQLGVDQFDLVKLDVEGAEEEILRDGLESWLPRTRMMVVEIHNPRAEAVLAELVHDGWSRSKWGENEFVIRREAADVSGRDA